MTKSHVSVRAHRLWVLGVGVWSLCFVAACGSPPPLEPTFPSSSALAGAVLEALADRDRVTLDRMALSEREFRDHVWPRLPASRPDRNLPFSYVWGELRQKSTATLSETLARHGGQRYDLLDVDFGEVSDYGTYRVHREATLRIRRPDGTEALVRVCGSMIEQDNAWKVFSYVID